MPADSSSHRHPVDPERVELARADALSAQDAERLGELMRVMAEPVRARILSALVASEEMCVGDLALALDITEDNVSYGLRTLRAHRLVERRAVGRLGYYRLADGPRREPLRTALVRLGALTADESEE